MMRAQQRPQAQQQGCSNIKDNDGSMAKTRVRSQLPIEQIAQRGNGQTTDSIIAQLLGEAAPKFTKS